MTKSLYWLKYPEIGTSYASNPRNPSERRAYANLDRQISLKQDLGWGEVADLQDLLRKADFWTDYPIDGVNLVGAEFQPEDLRQRIDLLYLRKDGGIFPAELKIGASDSDAAGQLLRYMADLDRLNLTLNYLFERHEAFRNGFNVDVARDAHQRKFQRFLEEHGIDDTNLSLVDGRGLLIDEGFTPQLLNTVSYLNGRGFEIGLLQFSAFVDSNWTLGADEWLMRLDLSEVTPP